MDTMNNRMNNHMMVRRNLVDTSTGNIKSKIVYGNANNSDFSKDNGSNLKSIGAIKKEYERLGNIIGISGDGRYVFIKTLIIKCDDMIVVDVSTGKIVDVRCNPFFDASAQFKLYKNIHGIDLVIHSYSLDTASLAQISREIPILGLTQEDSINQFGFCSTDTGILVRNHSIITNSQGDSVYYGQGIVI